MKEHRGRRADVMDQVRHVEDLSYWLGLSDHHVSAADILYEMATLGLKLVKIGPEDVDEEGVTVTELAYREVLP